MRPTTRAAALAMALVAVVPRAATAAFHVSVIDEVATSVADDPSQQFVEIRMLAASQNQVKSSVLAAFDARGTYAGDVLVVPDDLGGSGVRWLMATQAFQDRQGIAADFTFEPGLLPLQDGMICWGAPGDARPADPGSWDHSDFTEYVDCVAYGRFCGSAPGGVPVPATPADHSLVRTAMGAFTDQAYQCSETLTPASSTDPAGVQIAGAPCLSVAPAPCFTALSGGPPFRTDCYGEWLAPVVICPATDPSCHAGRAGDCVFRAQFCFDDATNPRHPGRCAAAPITSFTLRAKQKDDIDRENVFTVLEAVRRLGVEGSAGSVDLPSIAGLTCTAPFDLVVPLDRRGGSLRRGVRRLRAVTVTRRKRDSDRLKLVCLP